MNEQRKIRVEQNDGSLQGSPMDKIQEQNFIPAQGSMPEPLKKSAESSMHNIEDIRDPRFFIRQVEDERESIPGGGQRQFNRAGELMIDDDVFELHPGKERRHEGMDSQDLDVGEDEFDVDQLLSGSGGGTSSTRK